MDEEDGDERRDPDPDGSAAPAPYGRLTPDRVLLAGGLFVSTVGVVAVRFADPAAIPNRTVVYVAVLLPAIVAVAALALK